MRARQQERKEGGRYFAAKFLLSDLFCVLTFHFLPILKNVGVNLEVGRGRRKKKKKKEKENVMTFLDTD